MMKFPLFTLMATVSAAPVPPSTGISKIIGLLQDMKTTGESEMAEKNKEAAAKKNECVAAVTGLERDVEFTTDNLNEAKACEEEQSGKAQEKQGKSVQLLQEIAEHNEALAVAKKEYEALRATNTKEQGELSEGSAMLAKAYSVLKRALAPPAAEEGASLIQLTRSGALSQSESSEIQNTLIGLAAITDSMHVFNSKGADRMVSFLSQVSHGLSDDDSLQFSFAQQPSAKSSNYESKSGGILDAIEEMQKETADNLNKLTTGMLENRHAFELLSQQTASSVEKKTEQMNAANKLSAEAAGKAGGCKADKNEQQSGLNASSKQLKEKKFECKEYEEEHNRQISDMTEENQVLGKAIEILSGKFAAPEFVQESSNLPAGFLQVKKVSKHYALSYLSLSQKSRFSNQLIHVGQTYNVFSLIQAANQLATGKAGVFDKILKMINDMIVKLEDEQMKEAAAHADCQAKKKEGAAMTAKSNNKFDRLAARKDKNTAEAAKVAKKLAETQAQLKEQQTQQAESAKLRNEDSQANGAIVKEATESIDAITSALTVLREYFNGDSAGRGASEKASAILDILDTAQMDFEKCKVDTETAESASKAAFDKEVQAAAVTMASQQATIQSKTAHQKDLQKQITTNASDLEEAEKEQGAAAEFLKAVNEKCSVKVMSFEEKQAKRKSEIEGLKVALDILNEESEA